MVASQKYSNTHVVSSGYRGSNAEFVFCGAYLHTGVDYETFLDKALAPTSAAMRHGQTVLPSARDDASGSTVHALAVPKTLYDTFAVAKMMRHMSRVYADALRVSVDAARHIDASAWRLDIEGDGCDPGLSLKRQVRRGVLAYEATDVYQRTCWELNQEIVKRFATLGFTPVEASSEQLEDQATRLLAEGRSVDLLPKGCAVLDSTLFALRNIIDSASARTLVRRAVANEYSADPQTCALYRVSNLAMDDTVRVRAGVPLDHSLSFGWTPLTGLLYDGDSGSPMGVARFTRFSAYVLNIPYEAFHVGGLAKHLMYAPPLAGIARVASWGEYVHPRTRLAAPEGRAVAKQRGLTTRRSQRSGFWAEPDDLSSLYTKLPTSRAELQANWNTARLTWARDLS